jgi:hypothetical protein
LRERPHREEKPTRKGYCRFVIHADHCSNVRIMSMPVPFSSNGALAKDLFWRNSSPRLSFLHRVQSRSESHLCMVNTIQLKMYTAL